jgi:hypothetical protein
MDKTILQKFIDESGNYLIGQRFVEGMGASRGNDTWEAIFLTPDVKREYWVKDIGKMTYDEVEAFASEELKTIIHLGKNYPPFQYGIRRKDFIALEKVTCPAMELIVKCYQENISDYYKVLEVMKSLIK